MKYDVTLTGLNYRFGTQPFTVGQKVKLVKEPENDFGSEEDAIAFCTFLLRRTYTGQRGNAS